MNGSKFLSLSRLLVVPVRHLLAHLKTYSTMSLKHWSFLVHSKSRSIMANSSTSISQTPTKYTYVSCYVLGIPRRRTPPQWFHWYAPCAKSGSFLEVPCSSKSISWVVRERGRGPEKRTLYGGNRGKSLNFWFYVTGKWHLPQRCTKTWWKMVGKVVWSIVKLHTCKIHVRTCWVLVSFCSYGVCAIFVTAPTGGGKWTKGSRKYVYTSYLHVSSYSCIIMYNMYHSYMYVLWYIFSYVQDVYALHPMYILCILNIRFVSKVLIVEPRSMYTSNRSCTKAIRVSRPRRS